MSHRQLLAHLHSFSKFNGMLFSLTGQYARDCFYIMFSRYTYFIMKCVCVRSDGGCGWGWFRKTGLFGGTRLESFEPCNFLSDYLGHRHRTQVHSSFFLMKYRGSYHEEKVQEMERISHILFNCNGKLFIRFYLTKLFPLRSSFLSHGRPGSPPRQISTHPHSYRQF